jgi:hypothetical protein
VNFLDSDDDTSRIREAYGDEVSPISGTAPQPAVPDALRSKEVLSGRVMVVS